MDEKQEAFHYTYSSRQQEEVRRIRDKYAPREENQLERLRRLDKSAARPGRITALTVGSISVLLFGIGMCCTMVWAETMFFPGIIIGVIGIAGISAAYPLGCHITKKRREKLAPEIMRLADELMK